MRMQMLALGFLCLATVSRAEDWPAWRGARGQGISHDKGFPEKWSKQENIVWRSELPGPGNSTPIVSGGLVFVTQANDAQSWRGTLCYDRKTGQQLWRAGLEYKDKESSHTTNPFCSASPVTDGKTLVAWYGSAGLEAYDIAQQGKRRWHYDLGKFEHIWGNASSPIIVDDKVILLCGPGLNASLLAVNLDTGEKVWQHALPSAQSEKVEQFKGTWCTPIVATIEGQQQIVASLPQRMAAFDPKTGEELWTCRGLSDLSYTSPLFDGHTLVGMSGFTGPALGLKVGGRGDITDANRLWREEKNPQRIGSGVIHQDHIYLVNEPTLECIELATGKSVWKERVGAYAWSSMVLAEGKLYNIDVGGETHVIDASPTFKLREKNKLGELTRGSLALSDGQIFIRTYKALYCIGKP